MKIIDEYCFFQDLESCLKDARTYRNRMACAYELQNVYPTRAAAELAKEVKSNG